MLTSTIPREGVRRLAVRRGRKVRVGLVRRDLNRRKGRNALPRLQGGGGEHRRSAEEGDGDKSSKVLEHGEQIVKTERLQVKGGRVGATRRMWRTTLLSQPRFTSQFIVLAHTLASSHGPCIVARISPSFSQEEHQP